MQSVNRNLWLAGDGCLRCAYKRSPAWCWNWVLCTKSVYVLRGYSKGISWFLLAAVLDPVRAFRKGSDTPWARIASAYGWACLRLVHRLSSLLLWWLQPEHKRLYSANCIKVLQAISDSRAQFLLNRPTLKLFALKLVFFYKLMKFYKMSNLSSKICISTLV